MRTIDADELGEHKFLTPDAVEAKKWLPAETKGYQQGWNDAIDAIGDNAPTVEFPEQITIKCNTEEDKQKLLSAFRNAKLEVLAEEDRPHGEWIFGSTLGHGWMKCSNCCVSQSGQTSCWSYCPNCGADMRKGGAE